MGSASSKTNVLRKLPSKVTNPSKLIAKDRLDPLSSLPNNSESFSRDRKAASDKDIPANDENADNELLFKNLQKFLKPRETTSEKSHAPTSAQQNLLSALYNRKIIDEEDRLADELSQQATNPPESKLVVRGSSTLRTSDLNELVNLGHKDSSNWTPKKLGSRYGLSAMSVERILRSVKPCVGVKAEKADEEEVVAGTEKGPSTPVST